MNPVSGSARTVFLSFSDTSGLWALRTLGRQATKSGVFSEVLLKTELDLPAGFRDQYLDLLRPDVRGFGYWVWKPEIIWQTICSLPDGSLLVFLDAGCRLNLKATDRLSQYLRRVQREPSGILLTKLDLIEKNWTKGDVFDHFGVRHNRSITDSGQLQSGIIFLRVCPNSRQVVARWRNTFRENFGLASDTESTAPNFPKFIENRHDQSLLSVIAKMHGVASFSYLETEPHKDPLLSKGAGDFPIYALRARYSLLQKVRRKIVRVLKSWFRY